MPGSIVLEGWSDSGRWTILLPEPSEIRELSWHEAGRWPEMLESLERGDRVPHARLPFSGGWVGFISYEAAALFEGASPRDETSPEPAAWFARHDSGTLISPDGEVHTFGDPPALEHDGTLPESCSLPADGRVRDSLAAGYARRIDEIRESIAAGDVYQVNLTRRFETPREADPVELYMLLCGDAPPVSSAILRGEGWTIVSASPEVLLVFDAEQRRAESRPIKGTAEIVDSEGAAVQRLMASEKDASEHLMIVDLVRNDLGRVAVPGSVKVSASRAVRRVGDIVHLESSVTARVGEAGAVDLLRALMPAGSITGAPKRSAVAAIRRLEPVPRGIYTGAIGWIDDRGSARFSVAIRTAVATADLVRYHAGGGIVWDSDARMEDLESRWKARAFLQWAEGNS